MSPIFSSKSGLLLSAAAVSLLLPMGAQAQEAQPDAGVLESSADTSIGEIVVTARRRAESQQQVPIAITAQTGEMLAAKGVVNAGDLNGIAPALTVVPSARGENTPTFVLRGQRQNDTGFTLDPGVIIYFNEVAYVRPQGLNGALFDINTVQVLRGPQGTLFGRNSTGGAVLINTNLPTDRVEGYAQFGMGNFDFRDVEGVVNLPLTDTLAIRFGGKATWRDGYARNVNPGPLFGRRSNDLRQDAERVTLRFAPHKGFDTTFILDRFDGENNGSLNTVYAAGRAGVLANAANFALVEAEIADALVNKRYTYKADFAGIETAETLSATNITNLEINDSISLKNIVGYRRAETYSQADFDGTSLFIQRIQGQTKVTQFSEEFQILGKSDKFDWIAGLYYFEERGRDFVVSSQGATADTLRPSGVLNAANISKSGFASGTYKFGGGLSLSAGARYTWDIRKADAYQQLVSQSTGVVTCNIRLNNGTSVCTFPERVTYSKPTWSVSLNYQASNDLLLYAAHRRGYRSGGVQNRITTEVAAAPFRPETVNDIELGMKADFEIGGMPVRLNADVFMGWYKDLQRLTNFLGSNGTQVSGVVNAARGTVSGLEAELTIKPTSNLEINAQLGLLDPKYTTYNLRTASGAIIDASGLDFSLTPHTTANGSIRYQLPVDADIGRITFNANIHYQSRVSIADTPKPAGSTQPGYTLVNARLEWSRIAGSGFGVTVFANNLFDKYYLSYGTNSTDSLGVATATVGSPRMYGAQVRYTF